MELTGRNLPPHFIADAEHIVRTKIGRFTVYPGDEVETVNPHSLIIRREGCDMRIEWAIISDLDF